MYGYWLKPCGELIPVGFQEHHKMARIFGFYEKPVIEAILAGNIRIGTSCKELFISLNLCTRAQRLKLIELVRDSDSIDILVDINGCIHRPDNYIHLGVILSDYLCD